MDLDILVAAAAALVLAILARCAFRWIRHRRAVRAQLRAMREDW